METIKLYYKNPKLQTFSARVLSCQPGKEGWEVILDQTAFYPEGGGQGWDLGTLGAAQVIKVLEKEDQIVHTCTAALPVGETVTGQIDHARRRDFCQQHSGEHIVSGIIARRFGYHNVGFHMGAETITIDFDGMLTMEQLPEIEAEANEAVWQDIPLHIWYPEPAELARLPYRSKRALEGKVRIVEIPGYDMCACCGTHVERTGEIGIIKLLSCVKFHQGVRMEMICGKRAFQYLNGVYEQNRGVSQLLSAKPLETCETARRMQEELGKVKYQLTALENESFARQAEELRGRGEVLLFREGLSPDGLRRLAALVMETCGGRCALFSGREGDYKYVLAEAGGDVRALCRRMNEALGGRGGGKPPMAQGSVQATQAEIRAFFGA